MAEKKETSLLADLKEVLAKAEKQGKTVIAGILKRAVSILER